MRVVAVLVVAAALVIGVAATVHPLQDGLDHERERFHRNTPRRHRDRRRPGCDGQSHADSSGKSCRSR